MKILFLFLVLFSCTVFSCPTPDTCLEPTTTFGGDLSAQTSATALAIGPNSHTEIFTFHDIRGFSQKVVPDGTTGNGWSVLVGNAGLAHSLGTNSSGGSTSGNGNWKITFPK